MKTDSKPKFIYYFSTGVLTIMMFGSIFMYLFRYEETAAPSFEALGYPLYIIYPLAVAKLLGLIAIWSNKSIFLKHLAYAGFFYNFTLAFAAHIAVGDNQFAAAFIALILLLLSFTSYRRTLHYHHNKLRSSLSE